MAGELLQKINKLKELITQKNNEEFGNKAVEILNPDKVDEKLMGGEEHLGVDKAEVEMEAEALSIEKELRLSVSEEAEAIANYLGRAKKALKHGDHSLYVLYKELAGDEVVHLAQLQATLDILGMMDKVAEIKGRNEAAEILIGETSEAKEDEHTKKQRKLREKASKVAKDFDFVAEYSKGRLEQARQKVVGAINDLITGKDDLEGTVEKILKDAKKIVKPKKNTQKEDNENKKD